MPFSARTIARAQDCYDSFKRSGYGCGGCQLDGVCGMGRESAVRLAELMKVIDPSGMNIAMIRLGPIGEEVNNG